MEGGGGRGGARGCGPIMAAAPSAEIQQLRAMMAVSARFPGAAAAAGRGGGGDRAAATCRGGGGGGERTGV